MIIFIYETLRQQLQMNDQRATTHLERKLDSSVIAGFRSNDYLPSSFSPMYNQEELSKPVVGDRCWIHSTT